MCATGLRFHSFNTSSTLSSHYLGIRRPKPRNVLMRRSLPIEMLNGGKLERLAEDRGRHGVEC